MKRRDFLVSAAAAMTAAGSPDDLGAGAGKAKQSTLDRIAIMTLNFQRILKVPDTQDGPEPNAGAVRHRRDDRRQVRRPQGRVPALSPGLDRAVVPQGASEPAREIQVAGDADQSRVQRPEHVGAAPARPPAGDRSDQGVGRSRRADGRAAGHGESGCAGRRGLRDADAREQGLQHSGAQDDVRLRQVEGHHRLGRDARRRGWRPGSRQRSGAAGGTAPAAGAAQHGTGARTGGRCAAPAPAPPPAAGDAVTGSLGVARWRFSKPLARTRTSTWAAPPRGTRRSCTSA